MREGEEEEGQGEGEGEESPGEPARGGLRLRLR